MEIQCWANAQHSRRECLEVVGIPRDISNENLESKVLKFFSKVGCEILSCDIEACHGLTNNDRIIVKFLQRKDCDQVMSVKRDLQKLKMEDIGLRGSNSIFINPSFCHYYRILWSKSKSYLIQEKLINFTFYFLSYKKSSFKTKFDLNHVSHPNLVLSLVNPIRIFSKVKELFTDMILSNDE